MRIRSVVGWSSRGISRDSLMRSNYFHAIRPGLREGEPAKKMQEMFGCHRAVEPQNVACLNFCRSVLIELRASRAILPRNSSDSFGGVRELGR